ncbi:MAG TPA: type II toxin-antitoxin system VapC family toxin [Thermoanaerobaculia bacterium]|nr:type II toxin-antitoxin system VapC family toxin [Thermoanaerobaculia bacterium]
MSTSDGRYLLDTHTFVWMASAPERLGPAARERIDAPATDLLLSIASVWEMAIKRSLGKLELPSALPSFLEEQLAATRTRILDIQAEHAVRVEDLPWHHRDPFDRLLVAQARFETLPLLSRDPIFDAYAIERLW